MSALTLTILALLACAPDDPADTGPTSTDPSETSDPTDPTGTTDTEEPTDTGDPTTSTPSYVDGLDVLGNLSHDIAEVTVEVMVDVDLDVPSDLEFHPTADELWITNRRDDSVTVVLRPGQVDSVASRRWGFNSNHFLAKPAGLAFNDSGEMATIHDEDELTQGNLTPWDFMGPTLWTSNSQIFDGDHPSHLDMLHNTPLGVGIAWDQGNAFWVFDGQHGSLTWYDFNQDHGLGGADHSDGEIRRYVDGQVARLDGSVSHLALDHATGLLYVADTGNNRIVVLDTASGTSGAMYGPNYDGADQRHVDNATLTELVDGDAVGLQAPAGLELHDGLLWVTDHLTGTIWAFDLAGQPIDWLETGWPAGALNGLALDDDGNVWVVDTMNHEVLRISP